MKPFYIKEACDAWAGLGPPRSRPSGRVVVEEPAVRDLEDIPGDVDRDARAQGAEQNARAKLDAAYAIEVVTAGSKEGGHGRDPA